MASLPLCAYRKCGRDSARTRRELHTPCAHCAQDLSVGLHGHCFWHRLPGTIQDLPGMSSSNPDPARITSSCPAASGHHPEASSMSHHSGFERGLSQGKIPGKCKKYRAVRALCNNPPEAVAG